VPVEFTVGIPTHNRRETVLMALASALEQTRVPARVLVVADGCTDGTQDAVRGLGEELVEVIDLPKAPGAGYAHRNEVLERAGDGVVAWLGDDDLWLPDHLERIGELFDADAAGIVNSAACLVHEDGMLEPLGIHWRAPTYRERFLGVENRTPSSAVSHRAAAAREAGGWPAGMDRAGDWDLWQRMVRAGTHSEMVLTPTVLFFRASERRQSWPDRVAQNAAFLARMRDRRELARLRGEIAFAWSAGAHRASVALSETHAALASANGALAHARDRELAHRRELEAAEAERDRLAAELHSIASSAWWRMRRPFEPVLRLRRKLRQRA
jgi:glycosyltransferase involved in cell wall biosynthesis